jgi:membrane protein YdbS with pleckstrin-like domain
MDTVEKVLLGLMGLGGLLLVFCLYMLVSCALSPSFSLTKSEWRCTASHMETHTTWMLSGKVLVPITSIDTVCDVYQRVR